ncbi:hypothetical protein BUALT_Bualt07G0022700 [Buddleja alternifolia]|uniref:Oleosin n=1 Tax=Buddleja alternifolia TaxID=168488 RepID=A0AAV6X7J2_9LAMI|nr:hypothetical protein BUALT_Bualt07G0022700 [Buddleja alternifolia]
MGQTAHNEVDPPVNLRPIRPMSKSKFHKRPSIKMVNTLQFNTTSDYLPEKGPSTPQILAVVTLFPVGGILLCLAGLTLAGTLIGLTIAAPLFVIFSPILIPAVLTLALAVTGFLASGAFGITALSSVSWLINYVRRIRGSLPEHLEHGRRRLQDTAGSVLDNGVNLVELIVRVYWIHWGESVCARTSQERGCFGFSDAGSVELVARLFWIQRSAFYRNESVLDSVVQVWLSSLRDYFGSSGSVVLTVRFKGASLCSS